MSTELSLFVLQTDTEGSSSNVYFDKNIFIITDDKLKAYKFFFEKWHEVQCWIEIEKEACHHSGLEYRPYKDRTEEEKNAIRVEWLEDGHNSGLLVHRIPLSDIEGVGKLINPLKKEITSLKNQIKISALKESVGHLPSLPTEIFDLVIASHLE